MNEKIFFTTLAARLERAIHADVGWQGLDIMLFGWRRKSGMKQTTLFMRKKLSGEEYLTLSEAHSFSDYVGYDLTTD